MGLASVQRPRGSVLDHAAAGADGCSWRGGGLDVVALTADGMATWRLQAGEWQSGIQAGDMVNLYGSITAFAG